MVLEVTHHSNIDPTTTPKQTQHVSEHEVQRILISRPYFFIDLGTMVKHSGVEQFIQIDIGLKMTF